MSKPFEPSQWKLNKMIAAAETACNADVEQYSLKLYAESIEGENTRLRDENEKLRAANAELLGALRKMVDRATPAGVDSSGWPMSKVRDALVEFARDAIANATGEGVK